MQGMAWGGEGAVRSGLAWRRSLFTGAVWGRAALAATIALILGGAAGLRAWGAMGVVVGAGSVFTQCWQNVDLWRKADRTRMN